MAKLTIKQSGRLETIGWAEEMFGSMVTNRQFPRRDVLALVKLGMVESVGMVYVCDDDCCMSDVEREGFRLTAAGREELDLPPATIGSATSTEIDVARKSNEE